MLDLTVYRHPFGRGEDVPVLLHNLVHLLFLGRGAMFGGHGHSLLLALGADHQENKFSSLGNELTTFFCSNQRDSGRRWYL